MMWKHPVGRLRAVGLMEGVSYLLLLGVAMPLKYLAGVPEAVQIVGWVHGVLFMGFCVALLLARLAGLPWTWAALAFVAALLPFGPFVIDGRLRTLEGDPGPVSGAGLGET